MGVVEQADSSTAAEVIAMAEIEVCMMVSLVVEKGDQLEVPNEWISVC
jgi:hypothetical protein